MIKIKKATYDDAKIVFEQVMLLLRELCDNPDKYEEPDYDRVCRAWKKNDDCFNAFLAYDDTDQPVGVITLVECFAIYAAGSCGIINELYVAPEYRSRGVGKMLLDEVKKIGPEKGWQRIAVTAPAGEKWRRTVAFYEREGFQPAGPSLRIFIEDSE